MLGCLERRPPIQPIPQQGVAYRGQMRADLVAACLVRADFGEGAMGRRPARENFSERRLRA